MIAAGVIALLIPIFLLSQGGARQAEGEGQGGGRGDYSNSNDLVAGKPLLPAVVFGLGFLFMAVMIGLFVTVLGPFLIVGLGVLFLGGFLTGTWRNLWGYWQEKTTFVYPSDDSQNAKPGGYLRLDHTVRPDSRHRERHGRTE